MPEERTSAQAPPEASVDLSKLPLLNPEEGVFEAYANVVNANWTLYDLRLRFAELIQVPNDDNPNWENQHGILLERAAIKLPWHVAKYLHSLLGGVIANYEEINGELKPIKLPARAKIG